MAQKNTARVITIAATEQPQDIRLRVAAYARVSSSSDEQLNSFAAQNRYYTELISNKDNWQLVDIYADEGITGTSIEKRDDFKRMPYVANFYIFHELAHVKLLLDLDLRKFFLALVENQVINLCKFEDALVSSVVDAALLPKEDIACDAYALSLLFNFIYEKTTDYDIEFMVDSYIFSVLSLTELDTILERTISIADWHKTSWWRIFIALEVVCLCRPTNDELRKGIIETRNVARIKYDNYVELLERISHNIKNTPKKEKCVMFSEKWSDEVNQTLAIIRKIR